MKFTWLSVLLTSALLSSGVSAQPEPTRDELIERGLTSEIRIPCAFARAETKLAALDPPEPSPTAQLPEELCDLALRSVAQVLRVPPNRRSAELAPVIAALDAAVQDPRVARLASELRRTFLAYFPGSSSPERAGTARPGALDKDRERILRQEIDRLCSDASRTAQLADYDGSIEVPWDAICGNARTAAARIFDAPPAARGARLAAALAQLDQAAAQPGAAELVAALRGSFLVSVDPSSAEPRPSPSMTPAANPGSPRATPGTTKPPVPTAASLGLRPDQVSTLRAQLASGRPGLTAVEQVAAQARTALAEALATSPSDPARLEAALAEVADADAALRKLRVAAYVAARAVLDPAQAAALDAAARASAP